MPRAQKDAVCHCLPNQVFPVVFSGFRGLCGSERGAAGGEWRAASAGRRQTAAAGGRRQAVAGGERFFGGVWAVFV